MAELTPKSRTVTVLGSTGSIGMSTMDVLALHQDRFQVHGLAAGNNISLLAEQITRWKPAVVVVTLGDLFR